MYDMSWYNTLNKSQISPPAWLFAPVWSFLYFLIFLSFFVFLTTFSFNSKILPLTFFFIQLALNFMWSPAFFRLKNPLISLYLVIFMWIFLLLTIIYFYKFSKVSAILLVPYLLWTTFAIYLNFMIVKLNR